MKPPIAYYGSKVAKGPAIVGMFPRHDHYVEPFAGSLAVLLAKHPSTVETVNDLDGDLVAFWRVLRDQPEDLIRVCELTPHARAEFDESHRLPYPADIPDLERARRVWSSLVQGRAHIRSSTGWRYTISVDKTGGGAVTVASELQRSVARMRETANRIRRVQIECLPALEIVDRYDDPGVLFYVDPPYVRDTRAGTGYLHEMPDEAEHRDLAKALRATRAAVVLSGYRSPLYDELYAGWHVAEIPHHTSQGGQRKATCEVLWSNRELQTTGHLF